LAATMFLDTGEMTMAAEGRLASSTRRTLLALFACGLALDTSIGTWLGARGTPSLTTSLALGLPLLLPAVWHILSGRRLRRVPPAFLSMAAFVGWCALSTIWATQSDDSALVTTLTRVQLLAVVWMGYQLARSDRDLRALLAGYVLGCVALVALAWRNDLLGVSDVWNRYAADGFDPNDMAMYLALGIPMTGYLAGSAGPGRRMRLLYLAYVPLALSGVALSGSRTGGIAAVLAVAALLFAMLLRSRAGWALTVAALVSGGLVALPRLPSASLDRILSLGAPGGEAAGLRERDRIWQAGLEVLPEHLVGGVGAGGFGNAVLPYTGQQVLAHNTGLSVAVELGLVGVALFFAAFAMVLWRARRSGLDARILAWSILATCLVGTQALTWEHRKPLWLVLLVAMVAAELQPSDAPAHS